MKKSPISFREAFSWTNLRREIKAATWLYFHPLSSIEDAYERTSRRTRLSEMSREEYYQ